MKIPSDGFVVVPFIPLHQIDELIQFYQKNPHVIKERGFHSTMHQPDVKYRKSIFEKISFSLNKRVRQLFPDHIVLIANFVVKESGVDSDVGLHADWSYVDETRHRSINIWCPLVDTHSFNGRLMVCPATHFLSNDLRGTPFVPLNQIDENHFRSKAIGLNVKKGDAVIYDSALLHFSEPNTSPLCRLAIAIVLIPKDSQPIHCFTHNEKTCVYNINREFFLTHELGKAPSGFTVRDEIPNHPQTKLSAAGICSGKPSH